MSLATELATILGVFALAFVVRLLVSGVTDVSYSVVLVLAGLGVSLLGVQPPLVLSHDVIVTVLLPTLLFRGAVELDHQKLRENLLVPVVLVVVGLPVSVVLLGAVGVTAFDFPPVVALLFAAMILPTDPAAVLSLFEELGAPERLSVIVDAESLFNDGVAVVVFGVFFELVRAAPGRRVDQLLSVATVVELGTEFVVVGVGGLVVGVVTGYLGYRATEYVTDDMVTVLFTAVLAYGSFLLAATFSASVASSPPSEPACRWGWPVSRSPRDPRKPSSCVRSGTPPPSSSRRSSTSSSARRSDPRR